jgi:hypothetical protein
MKCWRNRAGDDDKNTKSELNWLRGLQLHMIIALHISHKQLTREGPFAGPTSLGPSSCEPTLDLHACGIPDSHEANENSRSIKEG